MGLKKQRNQHNWQNFVRAEKVPSAGQWIKLVANESECKGWPIVPI